jgi:uncharacterized protein (TIGR00299 family) protein
MAKILYIDAFSGISGDMFLGALIALGLDAALVEQEVGRLGIRARVSVAKAKRNGIEATDVTVVDEEPDAVERDYAAIKDLLESRMTEGRARDTALSIFSLLADAEARVHGTTKEKVHFHEVGAVDSIVDIVGVSLGLAALEVGRVISSPLPLGRGFVKTRHGVLPLPAPATVLLLEGVPVVDAGVEGELVTPTGAAIVKTVADDFTGFPPMAVEATGYGAGDRELFDRPNVLRLVVGRQSDWALGDEVDVVTTHIDDMNPQFYDYVMGRIFGAGALDVTLSPVIMKKGRPATVLCALALPQATEAVVDCILSETTSTGLRIHRERRVKVGRVIETVSTELGEIRVKYTFDKTGGSAGAYPEYEDVRAAAESHGLPIDRAYRLIIGAVNDALKKRRGSS